MFSSGTFINSKKCKTARTKGTINWNKYQQKVSTERRNQYLDFLIDPSFQGVNRHFVLLFENEDLKKGHTGYYLLKLEMKDYNVMNDGRI